MCEILPGRFFRRGIFYCAEEQTLMLKCIKLLLKSALIWKNQLHINYGTSGMKQKENVKLRKTYLSTQIP